MSGGSGVPYWLDEPYEPRPALEGHVEAEACVIGAGVAGLSCALALARAGVDTVVLERDTVAGGASGRNGGFLLAGVAPFYSEARELYGRERARRMYAATLEAQRDMYALAEELGAGDSMRRVGLLRASASEEEAADVARQAEALREDGFPGELVERERAAARGGALRAQRLPHRARRLAPAGALDPHAGARRRGRRGAHPRRQHGRGAGARTGRGRAAHARAARASAPATWWWPRTARCRRSCPSTRRACARAGST